MTSPESRDLDQSVDYLELFVKGCAMTSINTQMQEIDVELLIALHTAISSRDNLEEERVSQISGLIKQLLVFKKNDKVDFGKYEQQIVSILNSIKEVLLESRKKTTDLFDEEA